MADRKNLVSMMKQIDRPDILPHQVYSMLEWLESEIAVSRLAWRVMPCDLQLMLNDRGDISIRDLGNEEYLTMRSCLLLLQNLWTELHYGGLCNLRISQAYHELISFLELAGDELKGAERFALAIMMKALKGAIHKVSATQRASSAGKRLELVANGM